MTGAKVRQENARFVFFAHEIDDLTEPNRQIALSPKDLSLLNPNTRTCPIFRTRRDAEITKRVYRNVPILVDEHRKSGGNPWGIKFCRMFDQTNDAEHFIDAAKLNSMGYKLEGNRWIKGKQIYLPLYEAKMIQAYDHRAAGVRIEPGNWMRQGQTEETSLVEHQNPEFVVQPRYWVDSTIVSEWTKTNECIGYIGFKDITSSTNRRTMIAAAIPPAAVTNHFPLLLNTQTWRRQLCLLGNLNSMAYDYICRQKIGGITLNFFIVQQIPTLPPDIYDDKRPWTKTKKLEYWISDRVVKLTCTAEDLRPVAESAGFSAGVWKWKEDERANLLAEIDAAYFHLYQFSRDDIEYVLGTFQGIANEDKASAGIGDSRRRILEAYDKLSAGGDSMSSSMSLVQSAENVGGVP